MRIFFAVIMSLLVFGLLGCEPPYHQPTPHYKPVNELTVSMINAFRTSPNGHAHALEFAAILEAIADRIEWDGQRENPRLKTGVQIDDFSRLLREFETMGWSFLRDYPAIKGIVKKELDQSVGVSGGPITPERRAKWVASLRKLSDAARLASEQLP